VVVIVIDPASERGIDRAQQILASALGQLDDDVADLGRLAQLPLSQGGEAVRPGDDLPVHDQFFPVGQLYARAIGSGGPAPRDAVEAGWARPELVEPRVGQVAVGIATLLLADLAGGIPTIEVAHEIWRSQGWTHGLSLAARTVHV
jgi:hypothetical protein